MKKIFTFAAAALVSLAAWADDFPVQVTPADGSTFPTASELTTLSFQTTSAEYPYVGFLGFPQISCTKDGQDYDLMGFPISARPSESVNTMSLYSIEGDGEYVITVPKATVYFFKEADSNSEYITNQEPIVLHYTVGQTAAEEWKFTVDPENASTVESLTDIYFRYHEADYYEMGINSQSKVFLTRDGQEVLILSDSDNNITGKAPWSNGDNGYIRFNCGGITEPGVYQMTVPIGALWTQASGWMDPMVYNTQPIIYEWTVGEAAPLFTADPADGSVVTELSQVVLTYDGELYTDPDTSSDLANLYKGTELVSECQLSNSGNSVIVKFKTPQTEAGEYRLVVQPDAIQLYDHAYVNTTTNTTDLVFNYTIEAPAAEDWKFTVDPQAGAEVEALTDIYFRYQEADYYEIGIDSQAEISLTRDGQEVLVFSSANDNITTNPAWTGNGYIRFKCGNLTEPGVYQMTVPAGALWTQATGWMDPMEYNKLPITYEWNVVEEAPLFTVDPADGSVVTELSQVVLTYDGNKFADVDTSSDMVNLYNGNTLVSSCKLTASYSEPKITVKFNTPQTKPGEYRLVIQPEAFMFYDESYENTTANEEEIVYTYTIEGSLEFEFTTTPADGETLRSIEQIVFNYSNCAEASLGASQAPYIQVTRDGVELTDLVWSVRNDEANFTSTLTLAEKLEGAGEYVITLPQYMLTYAADRGGVTTAVPVTLHYTLLEPLAPVVYDLMPIRTNPADGATIDLAERDFNAVFVYVANDVKPAEGAKITIQDELGNYFCEPAFTSRMTGQISSLFEDNMPKNDGKYTVTIPQGTFGDAAWQENPEFGHANPEIVLVVTLTGGRHASMDLEPLSYTPETNVDPAALATITLTFAEGVQALPGAYGNLFNATDYNQRANFTSEEGSSVFTLSFETTPSAEGEYRLTIPAMSFADETFINTNGANGHANSEITLSWTTSGIQMIIGGQEGTRYFNLQGQPVATPAEGQILIEVKDGKAQTVRF